MRGLSRRDFGKKLSAGALSGLAASAATPLARAQGEVNSPKSSPKRMTTVLRDLIQGPGILDSPSIYDPLSAKIAESVGFRYVNLPCSPRGIVTSQIRSPLSLDDLAETSRDIT